MTEIDVLGVRAGAEPDQADQPVIFIHRRFLPGTGCAVVGVTVAWLAAVFWPVAVRAFPLFVLTAIVRDAVATTGLLWIGRRSWPDDPDHRGRG